MDALNPSPEGDASATRRGLVNLIAQAFAGAKTFAALLTAEAGVNVTGDLNVSGLGDFGGNVSGASIFANAGLFVNAGNLDVADGVLTVTKAGSTITLEEGLISADALIASFSFLNQLIFTADGSAGAPVLSRNGANDTGLFWPSAGLIAFSSNGFERVRIGNTTNFSSAVVGAVASLTSSAGSIAFDLYSANNFAHTLTENTTLAAPTHPQAGQSGVIVFTQHASSPKTLAFNSFWKFAGGTVPTLTATNGAVDVLSYYVESSGRATCALIKDVK